MNAARCSETGEFVNGPAGRRYRLSFAPVDRPIEWALILVAPFGEEMNRSRRFLAALCRNLASHGARVSWTDPFGSGDSDGEIHDARWRTWCDGLITERASLPADLPVAVIGLRSGCLLAQAAFGDSQPCIQIEPEIDGSRTLRRLLMSEVAARRFAGDTSATMASLQQALRDGHSVRSAGYRWHPELVLPMSEVRLRAFTAMPKMPVATAAAMPASLGTRRIRLVAPDVDSKGEQADSTTGPVDASDGGSDGRNRADRAGDTEASRDRQPVITTRGFWQLDECELDVAAVTELGALIVQALGELDEPAARQLPAAVRAATAFRSVRNASVAVGIPYRSAGTESTLHGVLHPADEPSHTGLIVVTGGGQTRVGAHRQFVRLARRLASRGVPMLRFDLAGRGDSGGAYRDFLDNAVSLDAALDWWHAQADLPKNVCLWGLCDGASAAIVHAADDRRVVGCAMVNPWIRTTSGAARVLLRHYYPARVRSVPARLWRGELAVSGALRSLLRTVGDSLRRRSSGTRCESCETAALPERVLDAVARMNKQGRPVLVVVARRDQTALEFDAALQVRFGTSGDAAALHADRLSYRRLDADHTFSQSEARQSLEALTLEWLRTVDG